MKKVLALALAFLMAFGLMGAALADDVTTLKVLVRTGDLTAYQPGIDALNAKLADAGLKVKLEWIGQASSGYPDFVNNMLLTWDESEVYDLIYVQGTAIDPGYLGSLGLLVDMTDLLANSANAKAIYDNDPILQAQFASCPYLM